MPLAMVAKGSVAPQRAPSARPPALTWVEPNYTLEHIGQIVVEPERHLEALRTWRTRVRSVLTEIRAHARYLLPTRTWRNASGGCLARLPARRF